MRLTFGGMGIGGLLAAVGLLAISGTPLFAQTPSPTADREQMDEIMDEMMGPRSFERMSTAMPGSERMMDQCVAMMNMMGMMGGGEMGTGAGDMSGMMGGESMEDMMRRTPPR